MKLRELVEKNRSYRGYDESYHFTKEQLLEYVDLTRFTAASINIQPLKYHITYDPAEAETVFALTKWARALPQMKLPHDGMHPTGFITICQDKNVSANVGRFSKDVGIVAQTILLAAVEEGLGGCMIGNYDPEEVKRVMNFPDNLEPLLIVALGKPAEDIRIVPVPADGNTNYYRDENDVHYVPKRSLEDILC